MPTTEEIQAVTDFVAAMNDLKPYLVWVGVGLLLTGLGFYLLKRWLDHRQAYEIETRKDRRSKDYSGALGRLASALSDQGRELDHLASRVESLEKTTVSASARTAHSIDNSLSQMCSAVSSSSRQLTAVVTECTSVMSKVVDLMDKRMSLKDTIMLFRRSFRVVEDKVQREVESIVRDGDLCLDRKPFVSASLRTTVANIVADESDYLNKYETYCSPERVFRVYDKPLDGHARTASRYHLCDHVWDVLKEYFTPEGASMVSRLPEIQIQISNTFSDEFDANLRDIQNEYNARGPWEPGDAPRPEQPEAARRACRIPSDY